MSLNDLLRLTLARARRDAGVLFGIAVAVALTAAVITGLPRAVNDLSARSLDHALDVASPPERGVVITSSGTWIPGSRQGDPLAPVRAVGDRSRAALPQELQRVLAPGDVHVTTSRWAVRPWPGDDPSDPTWLSFHVRPDAQEHAELTGGRWPARTDEVVPIDPPILGVSELRVLEIVVSDRTAAARGWTPGTDVLLEMDQNDLIRQRLPLSERRPLVARIVGTIEPTPTDQDPFWWRDTRLHVPGVQPTLSATIFTTAGLVADEAYLDLADPEQRFLLTYNWRADTSPDAVDAGAVDPLRRAAERATSVPLPSTGQGAPRASVLTNLDRVLAAYQADLAATRDTLGVGSFGLLALALLLVAIAGTLLAARRLPTTSLVRGRGASGRQILGLALVEGVLLTVAATAVGIAVTTALVVGHDDGPGRLGALALAIGVPLVLVTVTRPALRVAPGTTPSERSSPRSGRPGRLAAELLAIVAAVGAVALVRARATTSTGFDPVLGAAPALLVGAATVVVVRVTAAVMRPTAALAGRSRGLAGPLAARLAARRPDRLVPPLLALLVGTGIATFAAVTVDGIEDGQVRGAYADVGAAHRLTTDAVGSLEPPLLAALERVDAPTVTLAHEEISTSRAGGGRLGSATLAAFEGDLGALIAATPGATPLPRAVIAPAIRDTRPVVVSSRYLAVNRLRVGDQTVLELREPLTVTIVGVSSTALGLGPDRPWILVRAGHLPEATRPAPSVALVGGGPSTSDVRALAAAHDVPTTQHASEVIAERRGLPLAGGLVRGFRVLTALSVLFGIAGFVLGLSMLDRHEARTIAVLRTVGASDRELRRLVRARLAAIVTLGLGGGFALGIATTVALGPALDVGALTGAHDLGLSPGPTTFLVVAVTVLVVTLFSAIQVARSGRTDPLPVLRWSEP